MNYQITKIRNGLIQRIHVLKRDLALDEETYRTILSSCSNGKTSCKDIDDEYLNLIKQTLELQLQKRGRMMPTKYVKENAKIAKLGYLLKWTWQDIAGFVKHETQGRKVSTHSCTPEELNKVIVGMVILIEERLASGELKLSENELKKFLDYVVNRKPAQSQNRTEAL